MIHSEQITALSEKMQGEFKFFKMLSPDECAAFIGYCENRQVEAGGTLWKEGDVDNYAAFIIAGKLGIKKKTEFEGKHMIVGTFDRGTVVGELCLLTDKARSVTAVVLENVDVVALSSRDFERMIMEHPMLGLKLLKHIFLVTSKRLSGSYERIASIF